MKKTVLIIQSGAMGDIFIVAPIARQYFLRGYMVYWPVREQFFPFVSEYLPYVNALCVDDKHFPSRNSDWLRSDTMHLTDISNRGHYDLVLNLADRGAVSMEQPGETFEETKYRQADIPFSMKHHFFWNRNKEKENDLIAYIEETHNINIKKDEFVIAHLESSHGDRAKIPEGIFNYPVIEITKIRDFEIVDWYPIICRAMAIFCVESAVHQFIDGCIHRLSSDGNAARTGMYLLSRSSLAKGQSYTKSEFWNKKYMK
jgi:hypothetical protein